MYTRTKFIEFHDGKKKPDHFMHHQIPPPPAPWTGRSEFQQGPAAEQFRFPFGPNTTTAQHHPGSAAAEAKPPSSKPPPANKAPADSGFISISFSISVNRSRCKNITRTQNLYQSTLLNGGGNGAAAAGIAAAPAPPSSAAGNREPPQLRRELSTYRRSRQRRRRGGAGGDGATARFLSTCCCFLPGGGGGVAPEFSPSAPTMMGFSYSRREPPAPATSGGKFSNKKVASTPENRPSAPPSPLYDSTELKV